MCENYDRPTNEVTIGNADDPDHECPTDGKMYEHCEGVCIAND